MVRRLVRPPRRPHDMNSCIHAYMCTCVHVYMYTCVNIYIYNANAEDTRHTLPEHQTSNTSSTTTAMQSSEQHPKQYHELQWHQANADVHVIQHGIVAWELCYKGQGPGDKCHHLLRHAKQFSTSLKLGATSVVVLRFNLDSLEL